MVTRNGNASSDDVIAVHFGGRSTKASYEDWRRAAEAKTEHSAGSWCRSEARADEVREAMEANVDGDFTERLQIVQADLTRDEGWADAIRGCTYVLHVAPPFSNRVPEHEDDLAMPAVEGTLRVLKAAVDAGVRRVVLTSSESSWPKSCLGPRKLASLGSMFVTSRARISPP